MAKILKGLSSDEVKRSLELYGDNSLSDERKKGFWLRFLENLSDPIIRILLIAIVVQLIFTFGNINYFEICGILVAILISTTVSTLSEYRSEQAFEKMREDALEGRVSVLREGVISSIPLASLVVGDVVYLSVGEKIPADGEIIEGKITVDQSALNGESLDCTKSCGKDSGWDLSSSVKVFRGSVITDGAAVMRVGRVGINTYYGMVAKDVQAETRVSPLKLRLGRLAAQISKIGYVIAAVVGLVYLFNSIVIDNGFDPVRISAFFADPIGVLSCFIRAVTLMITVIVVAAPEGLPMMISVVLSANMKRMLADNIMVKKLVGIETAGSLNILFTDKTGTLTVGKPVCEQFITISGSYRSMSQLRKMKEIYTELLLCARYNTDIIKIGSEITRGNATERALYNFFADEDAPKCEIEKRESFSSEKKYSSICLKNGKTVIKGAAEIILSRCEYAINASGDRIRFDPGSVYKEYIKAVKSGLRVIGVAITEPGCDGLTLVALVVMKDRVRRGVPEAVAEVSRAGIQVVMITGDGRETAAAIAEECGIYNRASGHILLTSSELAEMNDDEIKTLLPRMRVVSRALPQDKTRLVRLSQEMDLVVGMTGDGINDAPSLKLCDVGFSMGSGTDIAKSASDIVILDDSFLAIAKTVLYGRTIFKSIRKFITFQLTMNICACGVSLFGQFVGVETPITIIQMLWVNIIMDTLGGLAFAGEAPMAYYMREKPKRRDEAILSREMLHQIFVSGAYTLALSIFFLASPEIRLMFGGSEPTDRFYTAFYVLFIFSGIFNCFAARSSRLWFLSNISKNKPFIFIMTLIIGIQIAMVYYGGALFRCVPLLWQELSFVFLLAMTVIPFELIRRLMYKLK